MWTCRAWPVVHRARRWGRRRSSRPAGGLCLDADADGGRGDLEGRDDRQRGSGARGTRRAHRRRPGRPSLTVGRSWPGSPASRYQPVSQTKVYDTDADRVHRPVVELRRLRRRVPPRFAGRAQVARCRRRERPRPVRESAPTRSGGRPARRRGRWRSRRFRTAWRSPSRGPARSSAAVGGATSTPATRPGSTSRTDELVDGDRPPRTRRPTGSAATGVPGPKPPVRRHSKLTRMPSWTYGSVFQGLCGAPHRPWKPRRTRFPQRPQPSSSSRSRSARRDQVPRRRGLDRVVSVAPQHRQRGYFG